VNETPPARPSDLVHDWNAAGGAHVLPRGRVTFDDESLRDGLQSPSIRDPELAQKLEILGLMERLGIHAADLGLPAAGPRAYEDTLGLARAIVRNGWKIRPNAAARTLIKDIEPIVDIAQKVGRPIEVAMFVGSSPIRFYTEDWDFAQVLGRAEEAVSYAVANGLPVMFVTEDTTRAAPDSIQALYRTAIQAGARRVTVADTVGHSIPSGVMGILRFVRDVADRATPDDVQLDWHGHNDRGLGVANALTAVLCGADQIHGTALGIGERCGNAAMDQVLVNLKVMGLIDNDLTDLVEYCRRVSAAVGIEIPVNYPVVGRDAFRTATGVHAAAVVKAARKGDPLLADMIYSGVPAAMVGREQEIEIGPMSGVANVIYWLVHRGFDPDPALVDGIFQAAKRAKSVLEEAEILRVVRDHGEAPSAPRRPG
jgi:2-isopropylmalate synthase